MLKELLMRMGWKTSKIVTPPTPKVKPLRRAKRSYSVATAASTIESAMSRTFQKPTVLAVRNAGGTMDSVAMDSLPGYNGNMTYNNIVTPAQMCFFSNSSFIGYQICALLSQHWLISKCCLIPAQDAVRNGYEITVNDGTEVKPEVIEAIKQADVAHYLNHNLIEMVQLGRVFGTRMVMFKVDLGSEDQNHEFYENPFNIDAITPGSYQGISQIDPYWLTFQLDEAAAGDPASIRFYEPTWRVINGMKIHHTHLIIFNTEEVPDILKTTYQYGGIPIPQKIFARVYAAERCANESPLLLLTKRTSVIKLDTTQGIAEDPDFTDRMTLFSVQHDNFGIKTIGEDEEYSQHDTSLAHVDEVIMTQYQLVSAAANIPAVKLLGTSPKGFGSTGEYEEASYHEELRSIQSKSLSALADRHHMLLIHSDIAPEFGIAPFSTTVSWNSLDEMTGEEQAALNKSKAEGDEILLNVGAIDADEVRERIIKDPDSGYSGLLGGAPEPEENPDEDIKNDYDDAG